MNQYETSDGYEVPLVNLDILNLQQKAAFYSTLKGENEVQAKVLVLDPSIATAISSLLDASSLKECGVEKMLYLDSPKLKSDSDNIIYIVRPYILSHNPPKAASFNEQVVLQSQNNMRMIADQIRSLQLDGRRRTYSIIFIPRRNFVCERILEEEGVIGYTSIIELNMDWLILDKDFLSLDYPNAFQDCFVDNTPIDCVTSLAKSIHRLELLYGQIQNIKGKGAIAKMVTDQLASIRNPVSPQTPQSSESLIGSLIILDRTIDLITPLLTQLTYEGLIDEFFRINNNVVNIEIQGQDASASPTSKRKNVPLNSSDLLYKEIRDLNFSALGAVMHEKAKDISKTYQERHSLNEKDVSEIKDFVSKLKPTQLQHQSLANHVEISTRINQICKSDAFIGRLQTEHSCLAGADDQDIDYIEACTMNREPIQRPLRLLSLFTQTNEVKRATVDNLKKEILQSYGYEHLPTLWNIEKFGLIRKPESKCNFSSLKKLLKLVGETSDTNPSDISYTYSGYAPITIRLIEHIQKNGFDKASEIMKLLPGPSFQIGSTPTISGTTMILFIGGITSAEATALRFLHQHHGRGSKWDFLIAATNLISGDALMEQFIESSY